MRSPNVGPDIEQRREETHLAAQDSMNEKDLQVKEPKKKTKNLSSTLTMQAVRSNSTAKTIILACNMPAPSLKVDHLCTSLASKKI